MRFEVEIHAISDIIKRLEAACENELKPVKESVLRHLKDFKDGVTNGKEVQENLKITLASFSKWTEILTNSKIVNLFDAFSEVYQQDISAVDFNKIVAAQQIRSGYMHEKNSININTLPKNKLKNLRVLRNSCYGYFDCVLQVIDVVISAKHRVIVKVWDGFQHNSLDKLFYLPQQDYMEKLCPASIYSLVSKEYCVEILTYGSFARDAKLLKPGDIVLFVNIHLAVTDLGTWNLTMHEGGSSFKRGIYHVSPSTPEYKEIEGRCMRSMEEFVNFEDSFSIDCLVSDLSGQNESHTNAIREYAKKSVTQSADTLNPFVTMLSEVLDGGPSVVHHEPTTVNTRRIQNEPSTSKTRESLLPSNRLAPVEVAPAVPPRGLSNVTPSVRTSSLQKDSNRKLVPSPIVEENVTHKRSSINVEDNSSKTVPSNRNLENPENLIHWPSVNLLKPRPPRLPVINSEENVALRNVFHDNFEEKIKNTVFKLPDWLYDSTLGCDVRKKLLPIQSVMSSSKTIVVEKAKKSTVPPQELIEVDSSDDEIEEIVIISNSESNEDCERLTDSSRKRRQRKIPVETGRTPRAAIKSAMATKQQRKKRTVAFQLDESPRKVPSVRSVQRL